VIRAILDTNVFLQALISRRRSASVRAIKALDEGRFRLVFSSGAIDELLGVLCLPRMRQRHGLSDDEILRFTLSFVTDALIFDEVSPVSAALPRDATDARVLSLAAASGADFLVTNDRRHLLRLKEFQRTRIVTPHRFLQEIKTK
jgi:uncharacterized protein